MEVSEWWGGVNELPLRVNFQGGFHFLFQSGFELTVKSFEIVYSVAKKQVKFFTVWSENR